MPSGSHSHGLDFAAILSSTLNATASHSIGHQVYGLSSEQIGIYTVCWMVAFCASISRSARDADGVSMLRCFGLGSTSGFFAVGTVGIGWGDPSGASPMFLLGISAFIGLLSKEQDTYIKLFFAKVSKIFSEKTDQ